MSYPTSKSPSHNPPAVRIPSRLSANSRLLRQVSGLPDKDRPIALALLNRALARSPNVLAKQQQYVDDPVGWIRSHLGEYLWSKQIEILLSLLRYRITCVKSCHSSGKSWLAGRIVLWWISCHPYGTARVITSAPTGNQVKAVLWHEIGRAFSAAGNTPGRLNQTEWWLAPEPGAREEMVAQGRKPGAYNTSAFQGFHEKYPLLIFDESDGIPKPLWEPALSLISSEHGKALLFSQPGDPNSEFHSHCVSGESETNVITISAFNTPNFTGEDVPDDLKSRLVVPSYVESIASRYGTKSAVYFSKVLGEFPDSKVDGLLRVTWIRAAQDADLPVSNSAPIEMGVDIAAGGNLSVCSCRMGNRVRTIFKDHSGDTVKLKQKIIDAISFTGATRVNLDTDGIGKPIYDDLAAQKDAHGKRLYPVYPAKVGLPAPDSVNFANVRSQMFWFMRGLFELSGIDIEPDDEDLYAQLLELRYYTTPTGKIMIESKRGRYVDDTSRVRAAYDVKRWDEVDSVMLSFLGEILPMPTAVELTWDLDGPIAKGDDEVYEPFGPVRY